MFIFLLLLWIIFNGNFTLEILIFGIIISLAVCLFCSQFLGYSFKRELSRLKLLPAGLAYVCVLLKEIALANVTVIKLIMNKRKLEPAIYHFHTDLKSDLAKTILANSITLTPGTITVSVKGDELTVHCLDVSLSEGISDSVFVKRLMAMEAKL